jgi:uncharacterized protein (DUF58 family)
VGWAVLALIDAAVLALVFIDGRRARKQRVSVERAPLGRLSIGRDNPVEITLRAGEAGAVVLLRDTPPFSEPEELLSIRLKAGATLQLHYTVRPHARGAYRWGEIHLRQLGPLGLGWDTWRAGTPQEVAVWPDLIGLRELSLRLAQQNVGALRQTRRFAMGTEFAEMREYTTADDPRLIDWKATARTGRPLVRVLEPEQEQTLVLLLDRGRLMTARVAGLLRFDWALNAALALAQTALGRGDKVGVAVFDRQIHTWIPPERGQAQMGRLLSQLAPIQPELLEPDYVGAVTFLGARQSRRALVVMLTDLIDLSASAELLVALGRLAPRTLPFAVTLRDPRLDALATGPDTGIDEAYTRAVALDLLAQRRVVLGRLQQKGVLTLDAPANRISDALIDRYLRLKARNLL